MFPENIEAPKNTNPNPIMQVAMILMRNFVKAEMIIAGERTMVIAIEALYNMPNNPAPIGGHSIGINVYMSPMITPPINNPSRKTESCVSCATSLPNQKYIGIPKKAIQYESTAIICVTMRHHSFP